MGQQASFTVYDGASTPVAHVLVGESVEKTGDTILASWREQIPTLPFESQVQFTLLKRKLKSGTTHGVARVELPVLEVPTGNNAQGYVAPSKTAFIDRMELVSYASPRSTEATKRICYMMLINWACNSASAGAAITAGPVAELHQKGIMVT